MFSFAFFQANGQCSPDITPPEITCPENFSIACPHLIGNIFAFQTSVAPTTSDNCGTIVSQTYVLAGATNITSASSGINDASSENFLAGTTTVTYTVIDDANNSSSCSFTVTIDDFTSPDVTCPSDLTLSNTPGNCFAQVTQADLGFATAFDNCNGLSTLASGITLIDLPDPALDYYEFPIGTTSVNWTVTDRAGNSSTCTQLVTIIDDENPVINCPTDMIINTNPGDCDASVNVPLAIVSDNCAVSSVTNTRTGTGLDVSGIYPVGVTTVTFEVTDSANNTAVCSFDITVVNSQLPVITLLGDNPVTLEACATYTDQGATALDSCLGVLTADIITTSTLDENAPGSYTKDAVGSYTITYNVTNAAGVAATQVIRTVNVVDTTPPTITLIGLPSTSTGICSVYTELGALAIDPCFGDISANLVIDNSAVDTNTLGTYVVTYNLTDDHGNSTAEITRTVNVIDVTAPDILLLGDNPLIIEACDGYTEPGATAIDPCSLEDFNINLVIDSSGVLPNTVGVYQVTYNATDDVLPTPNEAIEVIRVVEVVDTTAPIITLIGDNPQIIEACTPYTDLGVTVTDCSTNSISIDDSSIDTNIEGTYSVTYTVCDIYGNCSNISRDVEVVISNPTVNAGPDFSNTVCTDTTINLSANTINGTDATGLWTVTSGQTSGFSFSDDTSPIATFTGDTGETYTLTWTITGPCGAISDAITATFTNCITLDFDGVDDNINFKDSFNLNLNFTIELWIKSEVQNNSVQTVFSKRDVNNLINGYDIRVVNNYVSFNWNDGESLSAPYQINTNQWHHIAVSNSNGACILYIDGVEMNSASGISPISNGVSCIVGAMDQPTIPPFQPENYFDGGMDELRIWDVSLNANQIRKMMNQEIEDNLGLIRGTTVPLDISDISWANLTAYYKMNQSTDLISGNLTANNGTSITGVLRNMTTFQSETAPIPYRSDSDGMWTNSSTWLFGSVQAIPNSLAVDGSAIDWNIVTTSHNVSSGDNNFTVLGLKVNNNILTIENNNPLDGQSLRITDYLKIDGTLSLIGESQLLQNTNSVVDYTGTGSLKRDQQGTANLYNYNYWSSPVGINNTTYALEDVLYDGSQPSLWTTAQDANPTSTPITMSSRWLYTYENFPTNSYADWQSINEDSPITVGLGFLMKGSGAADTNQNYTFVGQPNNGTISTPITANYDALVGNPYPSAVDSHAFITDNSSSIQGTIYYWEHYTSNVTHVLEDYEGGYAAYNFSGGLPAVSPPEISGLGASLKIPERFIPVGQGFFVQAGTSNGLVTFENDQRVFVKEAVTGAADNGSVFMRTANNEQTLPPDENLIKRIRIHFKTPEGAIRPLLLAFTPSNEASEGFDYGYDAINTESFPNDMSWMINNEPYVIQGVGAFDPVNKYPLGLFMSTSGTIEIGLDALENFEDQIEVYVYDALTDVSFKINDAQFNRVLEIDDYIDRFFITFQPTSTLTTNEFTDEQPTIMYLNTSEEIFIQLPDAISAKSLSLFNTIGQEVHKWTTTDLERLNNEIRLKTRFISEGIYVLKLILTDNRITNKKIIIKYKD
ncbi:MAG: immunoglobulin-like domain-containing protein [Psychroserpens sp.]|uniref:immunoglobulin-like domain-containing protein n=1 Tax=Psychroserpens sp. TaxID=2020870 RepID=UPI0030028DF6